MTRGDTAFIDVTLNNDDGTSYVPQEGDKIIFRIRKKAGQGELALEKEVDINTLRLTIEPNDTKNLRFGEYHYEFELVTVAGYHFTFIANQIINIAEELESYD